MKLKRYLATNMRQAMDLVRNELGDDAVIMSTRNTDEGVEIVAAVEPDLGLSTKVKKDNQPRSSYSLPESEASSKEAIQKMANELKSVKDMLQNQLSGLAWQQTEINDPKQVNLLKKLVQLGIGWDLAQKLVNSTETNSVRAWSDILRLLEEMIPVTKLDIIEAGGIISLVGPTGVGKTTTIAKMASRFVMRNGAGQLALITTDCYKIGAQAQLKTFADLLGVPVHVAASEGELYTLLGSLAAKKLILIDTAGMSQKDSMMSQQPTKTQVGLDAIKNYLVVSAATQLSVMHDVVSSFGKVGLKGCILTKLDEATQLGNAVTVMIEKSLPLTYISNGQRVPEDLEAVNVHNFVDKIMVLGQQKNMESEEMAFKLGMGKDISDAQ